MKRNLAAAAVVIAALLLSGCTSTGSSSTTDQSGGSVGAPAPMSPESVTEDAARDAALGDPDIAGRDVITSGSVSITVTDPIQAAEEAATITRQAGGRVDSRTENPGIRTSSGTGSGTSSGTDTGTDTGAGSGTEPAKTEPGTMEPGVDGIYPAPPGAAPSAHLTLRIPADALDNALAQLKALGTVNSLSLNASDVTQQTRDLDARITSLQTSVDRLLGLMAQATSTTDLIAIEGALASRQSELESLRSQRDYLSDQIEYSTLNLDLYGVGIIAPATPDTFWSGIIAGWNALVAALGGAVVGLGFVLPWLLAIALTGAIVLLIVRLSTRKRKAASEPAK